MAMVERKMVWSIMALTNKMNTWRMVVLYGRNVVTSTGI